MNRMSGTGGSRTPPTSRRVNSIARLILVSIVASCLTGCLGATYDGPCPPWPKAGPKVAEELATIPYHGYEDTWAWFGQLDVLRDQLAICRDER